MGKPCQEPLLNACAAAQFPSEVVLWSNELDMHPPALWALTPKWQWGLSDISHGIAFSDSDVKSQIWLGDALFFFCHSNCLLIWMLTFLECQAPLQTHSCRDTAQIDCSGASLLGFWLLFTAGLLTNHEAAVMLYPQLPKTSQPACLTCYREGFGS